jgi:protein-tyrosine phosphatase
VSWLGERSTHGGFDRIPLPIDTASLWLCGKHAVAPDVDFARRRTGAAVVVCLVEEHELTDRYPEYVQWLRDHDGDEALWFPIHDLGAPPVREARLLVAELVERLHSGQNLLMHCGAGIGRAGTLAACVLMGFGVGKYDALATVAAARPMAGPEAGAQLDLVEALAVR